MRWESRALTITRSWSRPLGTTPVDYRRIKKEGNISLSLSLSLSPCLGRRTSKEALQVKWSWGGAEWHMRAGLLATGAIMSQVSTNKSYFIHSVFADQVSKATIMVQSHLTLKGGWVYIRVWNPDPRSITGVWVLLSKWMTCVTKSLTYIIWTSADRPQW